jgi:hypothetical protein
MKIPLKVANMSYQKFKVNILDAIAAGKQETKEEK